MSKLASSFQTIAGLALGPKATLGVVPTIAFPFRHRQAPQTRLRPSFCGAWAVAAPKLKPVARRDSFDFRGIAELSEVFHLPPPMGPAMMTKAVQVNQEDGGRQVGSNG